MDICHPLRKKYPDRIPIIVDFDKRINLVSNKNKLLVPQDISFGQLVLILRNMCYINSKESIYVFSHNKLPKNSSTIIEIYEKDKNKEDHVLYLSVRKENTFG